MLAAAVARTRGVTGSIRTALSSRRPQKQAPRCFTTPATLLSPVGQPNGFHERKMAAFRDRKLMQSVFPRLPPVLNRLFTTMRPVESLERKTTTGEVTQNRPPKKVPTEKDTIKVATEMATDAGWTITSADVNKNLKDRIGGALGQDRVDMALFSTKEVDKHGKPVLKGIVEAKRRAQPQDIQEAEIQLKGYCEKILKSGHPSGALLGLVVTGTAQDMLFIQVYKYTLQPTPGRPEDLRCISQRVTYSNSATKGTPFVDWFVTEAQVNTILSAEGSPVLVNEHAIRPSFARLQYYSNKFNHMLNSAGIVEQSRASVVAALLLALWRWKKEGGNNASILRLEDSQTFVADVKNSCLMAFEATGKMGIGRSLLGELDGKTSPELAKIFKFLEGMRLVDLGKDVDYLGHFYEIFFRYAGASKNLGQYFTPRWITDMMAGMAVITKDTTVFDPCCGTGGFLIAAATAAQKAGGETWEDTVKVMAENGRLLGIEKVEYTAGLCVVNMIVRGDGKTHIRAADCLTDQFFPTGLVDVVLTNPPFVKGEAEEVDDKDAHEAEEDGEAEQMDESIIPTRRRRRTARRNHTLDFIKRGLEALKPGGLYISVVPDAVVCGERASKWRQEVMRDHDLVAVIQLPMYAFHPYAQVETNVIALRRRVAAGEAGDSADDWMEAERPPTTFIRLDGLEGFDDREHPAYDAGMENKRAVPRGPRERIMPAEVGQPGSMARAVEWALKEYRSGVGSGLAANSSRAVTDAPWAVVAQASAADWSVGGYLPFDEPLPIVVAKKALQLARGDAAVQLKFYDQLFAVKQQLSASALPPAKVLETRLNIAAESAVQSTEPGTLGASWRMLRSPQILMSGLDSGKDVLVSGSTHDNAIAGLYDLSSPESEYNNMIMVPPFISVSRRGAPGFAFVQTIPAAVTGNAMVLVPPQSLLDEYEVDKPRALSRMLTVAAQISLAMPYRFRYQTPLSIDVLRRTPLIDLEQKSPVEFQKVLDGVTVCLDALNLSGRKTSGVSLAASTTISVNAKEEDPKAVSSM